MLDGDGIIGCSLRREESRGARQRIDPTRDDVSTWPIR
jgi:hypothetical protein